MQMNHRIANLTLRALSVVAAASFISSTTLAVPPTAPSEGTGKTKHFPDDYVYVDVTKPPYNADNTGQRDATAALNRAFTNTGASVVLEGEPEGRTYTVDGHTYRSGHRGPIIYLPPGTYLVSDRIMPSYPHDPSLSAPRAWIQGAGIDKTIIKLKDNAPNYQNTGKLRAILRTGCSAKTGHHQANSAFNNHVADLTIVNGTGNPAAIGLWYDAANSGVAENIKIDGTASGFAGITCGKTAGTGLLKNIEVKGFDYGVHYFTPDEVNNFVYEHITVREQKKAGFYSLKKMTVVRDFQSYQSKDIPAIVLGSHHAAMILLGAKIRGTTPTGSFSTAIQIHEGAPVYFRDITLSQYKKAIDHRQSSIPDLGKMTSITDYQSTKDHQQLLKDRYSTLRLPVRETPSYHPEAKSLWRNARDYGVIPNDGKDDSDAIEKAIQNAPADSVLYFPYGYYELHRDIEVRTKARKIDFCGSRFNRKNDLFFNIVSADNKANEIIFNNLDSLTGFRQTCNATLVIKNKWYVTKILSTEESKGDIIIENLGPFPRIELHGGNKLWAHSINGEVARQIIDNSMAWLFGVNNEMKAKKRTRKGREFIRVLKPQIKAVNYAVVETYNIQDDVNHDFSWEAQINPKHDYFVYHVEDSIFSVAAAGAHRFFDGRKRQRERFTIEKGGKKIYRANHTYINKLLKVLEDGEVDVELYHRNSPDSIYSKQSRVRRTENSAERSFIVYTNAKTPVKGRHYDWTAQRKRSEKTSLSASNTESKAVFYKRFEAGKGVTMETAFRGKGSLAVKGNGKRRRERFKVTLKPDTRYRISAAVKKVGQFSANRKDTQIVFMNKAEQVRHLAHLGIHLTNDGKWHLEQQTFETGGDMGRVMFFVRNDNSNGTFYVDDLAIYELP